MNLIEIEKSIAQLSREELSQLFIWLENYNFSKWDEEIEKESTKLEELSKKVLIEFANGKFVEL